MGDTKTTEKTQCNIIIIIIKTHNYFAKYFFMFYVITRSMPSAEHT